MAARSGRGGAPRSPFSPVPSGVPEHCAGGSGGYAETLAGSPQPGEGLGGGSARRSRAGVRGGRGPQRTPSASVRARRDVGSWPPCPLGPSGARRSGRRDGGGRVRFCTSGTGRLSWSFSGGRLSVWGECVRALPARCP